MTATKKNNNGNNLPSTIDPESMNPELLGQFFQNQAKEIELRQNELSLKKQQDDHSYDFAREALKVKADDRASERFHDRETQKIRFIFVGIVVIIITGLVAYSLFLGKENFAMEIIKAAIFLLSGGAGGFAIGKSSHPDGGRDKKIPKRKDAD
jgi:hypothetical protein